MTLAPEAGKEIAEHRNKPAFSQLLWDMSEVTALQFIGKGHNCYICQSYLQYKQHSCCKSLR